MIDPFLPG